MIFLLIYLSIVVFYTLYIAAINLYYDWHLLPLWLQVGSAPIMAVMVTVDALMNVSLFTVIFFDLPRELMVTQRLERYRTNPAYAGTFRNHAATLICTEALNPFDPTRHHC